ncbi:SMI1/KNR4 family protein [Sphingobacterium bambusae]|uniref:SMI1/KNR4 family protein n=1 Tax=Sphingobacterium bambusae TaxID=662858 RepID=A0ABW6BQ04_9SPHI|nr:SMI1/KNR4 family protein [Sphingobacterium bambusae]WPL47976.1 SMI1/KNR4 family protein [Sphingobacterium bambusae]
MTNLEIIDTLKKTTFLDEDGESYTLDFHDQLSDLEIENLRASFPNKHIATEILEILQVTRGWDSPIFSMVYFDSIDEFGFWELSPNSITLGHDGFGNYWVLDIDSDGSLGKVFFACHDPAVFIVHSQNINEYLQHLLDFHQNPGDNYIENFQINTVTTVWEQQNGFLSKVDFMEQQPDYSEFLSTFVGDDWTIADLSQGQNGMGFAWGKFGPNQLAQRHPTELIWVLKNRKKGFFSRLFG